MKRRNFIKTSLLGSSVFFIPNVVMALDQKSMQAAKSHSVDQKFFTIPDFEDFKHNLDGTIFYNTKIGFLDHNNQPVFLPETFYITNNTLGYGTPTLYFDQTNHYVFVSELYKDYKMNGHIFVYNHKTGFEKNTIFRHENRGWYAFWGKTESNLPNLYHYDFASRYVHKAFIENNSWENGKLFMDSQLRMATLYQKQLNAVNQNTQQQQYRFKYEIHKDGFYDFLKMVDDWKTSKLNAIKDQEQLEFSKQKQIPSYNATSHSVAFRNIQSLAHLDDPCDCNNSLPKATKTKSNVRLQVVVNKQEKRYNRHQNQTTFATKIGFFDQNNCHYALDKNVYCTLDVLKNQTPILFCNNSTYTIQIDHFENNTPQTSHFTLNLDQIATQNDAASMETPTPDLTKNHALPWTVTVITAKPATQPHRFLQQTILFMGELETPLDYTNPFEVVYCLGDDLTYATETPSIIYQSIPSTEVIIPNMPAYKTQDGLGECRAFALATLLQKYTCDKWKSDIPDCKNPPADSAISYFGLLAYTNRSRDNTESFEPRQDEARSMMNIIDDLSTNGNQLILESCKPFDTLVNSFDMQTLEGRALRDQFLDYLQNLYAQYHNAIEANITACRECVTEINAKAGLNTDLLSLKKALMKDTYDKFLYSLFFDNCKFENFPAGFSRSAFPADSINATPKEIKLKALEGLKLGKPVMFPSLCAFPQVGDDCKSPHAIVVSGFKTG